jgi:hypothetical protein
VSKVYCVSYDLNSPGQDYKNLYNELKRSNSWWHYLESTWLINTNETASQFCERLRKHIDKNDGLLIIEVTNNYQGCLSEEAWKWIRENVKSKATSFTY